MQGPSSNSHAANCECRHICLTPAKNEAWIIRPFLAAARTWADHVIVADQGSTDGTLETLRTIDGVETVINDSPVFDEAHRQKLLLNAARQIPGRRILIGLDADEALSANFATSESWARLDDIKPGTVLRFRWANILPGFNAAWIPPKFSAFGYVDDNCDFTGWRIHSPRVPYPPNAPVVDIEDVVVLHFQYVIWERMLSKQRWYQAWEFVKHQKKGPLQIYREYNHMFGGWNRDEIQPVRPEWFAGYEQAGINFQSLKLETVTWWDREIVQMLLEHGPAHYRKIAIWDQDWNRVAASLGLQGVELSDPRTWSEKFAHRFLRTTQAHRARWVTRSFEKMLRWANW